MNRTNCNNNSHSSSSDDSFSSDNDAPDNVNLRKKRAIAWCGVEDAPEEASTSSNQPQKKLTWPPKSPSNSNWRRLRPSTHFSNPNFGTKMQLLSRTNHHLSVFPDGSVKGTPDENDLHTYLELINAGHSGHVRIKGLLTNLFIGMDKRGRLFATSDRSGDETVFVETLQGSYSSFLSLKYAHLGWYLGLKKSGKFKRGPKTKFGQKAVRFLPRRSKFQ